MLVDLQLIDAISDPMVARQAVHHHRSLTFQGLLPDLTWDAFLKIRI